MALATVERYQKAFSFPVINFYRELGFDFQRESFDKIADEYIESYSRRWKNCQLHAGALDILRFIDERQITQSVLSAYQQERLEEAVDYFGLRRFFVKLIGLNDHYAAGKTENGKHWVNELHYAASEILFIGDTRHDYEVAQTMEVDCVLMTFGHNSPGQLANCPVQLLDSLEQLRNFLACLP